MAFYIALLMSIRIFPHIANKSTTLFYQVLSFNFDCIIDRKINVIDQVTELSDLKVQ